MEMEGDANQRSAVAENPKATADLNIKKRKGILSRIWNGIFRRRNGDFEKKLQHLFKEEASIHARMKRRAQRWRKMARNLIVSSVVLEVVAVVYAIMITRSLNLNWKMRAVRVLPMFALPALSFLIYSTLVNFTRMCDRKDQKTLERLRAERQAKIDELKESTNYYITQQLIQRYDPDPAAKAAAASVLASKLGAESGLKVYVGDESNLNMPTGKSNDVELVQSRGLRNRKQPLAKNGSTGSGEMQQLVEELSLDDGNDSPDFSGQNQAVFVEHHPRSAANDGGWIARIAALLVGEDPAQCYALICGNCHMHNGLARKEDFPHITYYCPHCHALNGSRQQEEHGSGSNSGKPSSPASGSGDVNIHARGAEITSSNSAAVMETAVKSDDLKESVECAS
ncbi:uncharacterized protein At2g24330-like isoform X2 [Magnolia sinica]|uniref:uncharacterized protein At2g24330-like isoform X2 n=1 Tax=Magnolia sinica TaxID=86752 RepID=UPI0026586240|nr:uncharacterized protein At2g24330-like isoform X2 [Magnolia sinica]